MNILVTGANGQLGNEMRVIAGSSVIARSSGGRDSHGTASLGMTDDVIPKNDSTHSSPLTSHPSPLTPHGPQAPISQRGTRLISWTFTDIVAPEGVETTILDITDLDAVRRIVRERSIDVIVNCAAYTNVDAAESNFELAELLNAKAPENLAIAMKEVGGMLVHVSTDYVFGGDPYNTPCREDQTGTPTGVYGLTKLHGEQNIIATGCRHVIIRTAWLYSEFGKNFVKTMLRLTAEKPQLNVVFDQVGTPTYALDLAKAIMCIIAGSPVIARSSGGRDSHGTASLGMTEDVIAKSDSSLVSIADAMPARCKCPLDICPSLTTSQAEGLSHLSQREALDPQAPNAEGTHPSPLTTHGPQAPNIYHYSNEGVCSWYDFAKMIAQLSGHDTCDIRPCHSDEFPSPVKRPAFSVLDKTKIKETFGVEVPYWTDSLKVCLKNMGEMK